MSPENELTEVNENQNYIEAINELKANTVDKKAYEKLKAENKQLLDTLVSGGQIEQPKEKVNLDTMSDELFHNRQNLTNLDFVQRALELRTELIAQGNPDPFVPFGHNANITQADIDQAERVAQIFQDCVDESDGDPGLFTALLAKRTR